MTNTKLIDENGRFKAATTIINDIAVLDTHKENYEDFELCDCMTLEKAYEIANTFNAHDELMDALKEASDYIAGSLGDKRHTGGYLDKMVDEQMELIKKYGAK